MKPLEWIGLYAIAIVIARLATLLLGDWSNYILLAAIWHLYWIKKDK